MPIYLTIFYLLFLILILIIGISVFDRKIPGKKYFSFLIFSIIIRAILFYFSYYQIFLGNYIIADFLIKMIYGISLFPFLFLNIFLFYYPIKNKENIKTNNKNRLFLFYLFLIIFFAICSFTNLVHNSIIIENNIYVGDLFGSFYLFYVLYFLFAFIFAIKISISKMKNEKGIEKNKIVISSLGLFSFGIFVLITNVVLPIFDIFILQKESILFSILLIFPIFYSMQKHRFFNISIQILNFLRILILTIIFISIIILTDYILKNINLPNIFNLIIISFFGFLAIYFFSILFPQIIKTSIDILKQELNILKIEISYLNKFSDFIKKIEKIFIEKLHFSNVGIFIFRDKNSDLKIPYLIQNNFYNELKFNGKNIFTYEEIDYLNFSENQEKILKLGMEKIGAKIILPLFSFDKLIGIFILGDKENKNSLSIQEFDILEDFRKSLEFSFMNILLNEKLEEENDLMKKIINKKTKSLQDQNNQISQLLKQQSDFISIAAHEFRTPLSVALFQIEDVLDDFKKDLKFFQEMKIIQKSLEKLNILTKNLFETQKYDLEKIEIKKEKIDLVEFLRIIFFECEKISSNEGKKIILENFNLEKLFYEFDEIKIRQVFFNLITNAIKFTPKNGKILISGFRKNEKICLSIEDNGIGISEEKKDFVFEKFKTNQNEKNEGIGLGLYISKKIIELHGGEIRIEKSKKLGGAKMIFCF